MSLLKGRKKTLISHGMPWNFYDFVDKIYQTAGKFKEVKTEHFLFRYAEDKDAILVDYAVNTLEKAYHAIGKDLDYFPKEPILVEVFPDAESFCTISTLTKEEIETSRNRSNLFI